MANDRVLAPDICVIGAGAGGLAVAAAAAQVGLSVVMVEKRSMGGSRLHDGCVPSKALLAAAKRAQAMREAGKFGVRPVDPAIDHRLVHQHVHEAIASIAPNDSAERYAGFGVQVIFGTARFKDKAAVTVNDIEIRARRFVVATGSSPAIPPVPGLEAAPYFTNETIFEVNYRIGHLIVLGGGPIGLEMAQAHRRLGSEATVLEALSPLGGFDPELAEPAIRRLRQEGVRILDNARLDRVEMLGQTIQAIFAKDGRSYSIEGTHLLVATGRKPNVDDLNLEAAGVKFDRTGISVNGAMRTSNRRIYAIGDVAGGPQFSHVASHHAGVVLRNILFKLPAKADHSGLPRIAFTEPEVAQIGLTEEEARRKHKSIRVLRWPYHENDRAQAERYTGGFVKVVTTKRGRILGAGAVGEQAGEIIQLWSLAMQQGIGIRSMASYVAPYPTLAEINKRAAVAFFLPSLANPLLRRVIGWLARLG